MDNDKKLFPLIMCECCKKQIKHIVKSDKKIIINPTPSSSK